MTTQSTLMPASFAAHQQRQGPRLTPLGTPPCFICSQHRNYGGFRAPTQRRTRQQRPRNSDLDLLIVGDIKDRPALIERLTAIGGRLNRAIDPVILSPEQFESGKRRGDRHVASALAGVRVLGNV